MVDVAKLKQVRDFLATHEDRFCYGSYISNREMNEFGDLLHTCGTTGCVAGWALAMFKPHTSVPNDFFAGRIASDLLGLTMEQRAFLFVCVKRTDPSRESTSTQQPFKTPSIGSTT